MPERPKQRHPIELPRIQRHFGLDWLRIGAFGLLILYHIGLFFGPWGWHVRTAQPQDWVVYLLFATSPWRMSLLFLVSGYATRALLARSRSTIGFLESRSLRLLVPLAFGVAVLNPPQPWVEMRISGSFAGSYADFWLVEYLRMLPGATHAIQPVLSHLWFLPYVWVYAVIVAIGAAVLPARLRGALQEGFAWSFAGWRMLVLPIAWLVFVRAVWLPGVMPSNRLIGDSGGHALYLPAFLFGFALAASPVLWPAILRWWRWALGALAIGYATILWTERLGARDLLPLPLAEAIERTGYALMTWGAILALLALAQARLNDISGRAGRWRETLTEAVFPFYLIHQTIIVVTGWYLLRFGLHPAAEFVILLAATIAGCWLFYALGRQIGWLRPLIGLNPKRAPNGTALDDPAPPRDAGLR